jgi:Protein of unknown function (DUF1488)
MPLEHSDLPISETDSGISFSMKDGAKTVPVIVTDHALRDVDKSGPVGDRKARFGAYRYQYEDIASNKYDAGEADQNGSVWIYPADLGR